MSLLLYYVISPGGGSGIGRAVCQRFAAEGASVVVADISEGSANQTLESLPQDHRGQEHMALGVDVSSKESVEKLVTSIQCRYFQPPSVCVSAAGITLDEFLLKMEEKDFDRVIQVNLKGTYLLTQAVSKALVASGSTKGSIITVGSIVGKVADVCAFLASDDSRYITGVSIEVAGMRATPETGDSTDIAPHLRDRRPFHWLRDDSASSLKTNQMPALRPQCLLLSVTGLNGM
ncbi:hypothetical protein JZ751_010682 [Albula glossodonta]|uniref:Estradiol 17-beta-dehydrogenase 8 n=1 Tax=Albula glossodonta TaxID=121402 RepID=A0A8T2N7L5_9TELE|nr:hypothetical protein JZ751_010682 [Albula glossodonta]